MIHPVIWYAVFAPKKKHHWWARKFGHVSLLAYSNDTWTHIDLHRHRVDVRTFYAHDEVRDGLSFLLHYNTILKVGPAKDVSHFYMPLTCVTFVKHTLGIPSRALRPDALYRTLVHDHNAEIVNEGPIDEGNAGTGPGAD